jgi:hypothetical protein
MYILKSTNLCPWLRIGSYERCGNRCVAEYCFAHNSAIKKGSRPPGECSKCGKGTQCIIGLCKDCGQRNELTKLAYRKKKEILKSSYEVISV